MVHGVASSRFDQPEVLVFGFPAHQRVQCGSLNLYNLSKQWQIFPLAVHAKG